MTPIEELHIQLSRPLDCTRTAEDAVNGFMESWLRRDWDTAVSYCQLTWINGVFNPGRGNSKFDQTAITLLKSKFRNRTLEQWEIIGRELAIKHPDEPPLDPTVIIDINVRVVYTQIVDMKPPRECKKKRQKRSVYHSKTVVMKVRCLRERGVCHLDRSGEWSVNPESMSRQQALD